MDTEVKIVENGKCTSKFANALLPSMVSKEDLSRITGGVEVVGACKKLIQCGSGYTEGPCYKKISCGSNYLYGDDISCGAGYSTQKPCLFY